VLGEQACNDVRPSSPPSPPPIHRRRRRMRCARRMGQSQSHCTAAQSAMCLLHCPWHMHLYLQGSSLKLFASKTQTRENALRTLSLNAPDHRAPQSKRCYGQELLLYPGGKSRTHNASWTTPSTATTWPPRKSVNAHLTPVHARTTQALPAVTSPPINKKQPPHAPFSTNALHATAPSLRQRAYAFAQAVWGQGETAVPAVTAIYTAARSQDLGHPPGRLHDDAGVQRHLPEPPANVDEAELRELR